MPIYDFHCADCGQVREVLLVGSDQAPTCPQCGGTNLTKQLSTPSSLTGRTGAHVPGADGHGCCGSRPGQAAGCAGPGSCCGKA